jgi:hypothetical protein
MPLKRAGDIDMKELEAGEEDSPEEEASEASEEAAEGEMEASEDPSAGPAPLDQVSDDDLLAEMKKRGLMKDLEEGESEDQDMYS